MSQFLYVCTLLLLSLSSWCKTLPTNQTEIKARSFLDNLIKQMSPKNKSASNFKTEGCPKVTSEDVIKVMALRKSVIKDFRFSQNCDLQGTMTLKPGTFPISLDVRHLGEVKHVASVAHSEISTQLLEGKMSTILHADQGEFDGEKGKRIMAFDAVYGLELDLSGELQRNEGGTIAVKNFKSVPVHFSEPLAFR